MVPLHQRAPNFVHMPRLLHRQRHGCSTCMHKEEGSRSEGGGARNPLFKSGLFQVSTQKAINLKLISSASLLVVKNVCNISSYLCCIQISAAHPVCACGGDTDIWSIEVHTWMFLNTGKMRCTKLKVIEFEYIGNLSVWLLTCCLPYPLGGRGVVSTHALFSCPTHPTTSCLDRMFML